MKFKNILAISCLALLPGHGLPAAQFSATSPDSVPLASPPSSPAAAVEASEHPGVLDYAKDYQWEKHAEIRSGNVIVLRRSTDIPPAKNETVLLRWRTPTEFAHQVGVSSKGLSSATRRMQAARLAMN